MPYKDKNLGRIKAREAARRRTNSKIILPPITKEQILNETIDHGEWVEAPLHNYKYELVGYTKLDKDVWVANYYGERLNLERHGYARHGSKFVHYNIIGKPTDRWIFIDHINRDRLDNRRINLRFVTPKGNSANSIKAYGGFGVSGYKGVHFVNGRKTSPWKVTRKRPDGEGVKNNYFRTKEEAIEFAKSIGL